MLDIVSSMRIKATVVVVGPSPQPTMLANVAGPCSRPSAFVFVAGPWTWTFEHN